MISEIIGANKDKKEKRDICAICFIINSSFLFFFFLQNEILLASNIIKQMKDVTNQPIILAS